MARDGRAGVDERYSCGAGGQGDGAAVEGQRGVWGARGGDERVSEPGCVPVPERVIRIVLASHGAEAVEGSVEGGGWRPDRRTVV